MIKGIKNQRLVICSCVVFFFLAITCTPVHAADFPVYCGNCGVVVEFYYKQHRQYTMEVTLTDDNYGQTTGGPGVAGQYLYFQRKTPRGTNPHGSFTVRIKDHPYDPVLEYQVTQVGLPCGVGKIRVIRTRGTFAHRIDAGCRTLGDGKRWNAVSVLIE